MSLRSNPFPPYGLMNVDLMDAIGKHPVPQGYQPPAGQDPQVAWKGLYDGMVDQLAARFWPRWRRPTGNPPYWDGAAQANMLDLTRADFELLALLQGLLGEAVAQQAPGAAALASKDPHQKFFRIEDSSSLALPVLKYFTPGDRALLKQAAQQAGVPAFSDRVLDWMDGHCTASTLPSKDELQRPRPYQMASVFGLSYSYQFAEGAVTSSLPSGHAIQGVQGICKAYLELAPTGLLTPDLEARMRQYAVDHGDRRVFAGVHYPSDNLASWCMALYLCDALYDSQAALGRRFLVTAIKEHSLVFRAITGSDAAPYGPLLSWFNELATA